MEENDKLDEVTQYLDVHIARNRKKEREKDYERKIMLMSGKWGVVGAIAGVVAAICSLLSLLRLFNVI